jgi:hypothetical protein
MKYILPILAYFVLITNSSAQGVSSSASQRISLELSNAIAMSFQNTGNNTGNEVNLSFITIGNLINGVASGVQQLQVKSNKQFNISVATTTANFTYSGSVIPAPVMPVSGVLNLKVASNNTGGSVPTAFNGNYAGISNTSQQILANAPNNNNATFAVQYQAIPGAAYPAGSYSTSVLYTATQP